MLQNLIFCSSGKLFQLMNAELPVTIDNNSAYWTEHILFANSTNMKLINFTEYWLFFSNQLKFTDLLHFLQ